MPIKKDPKKIVKEGTKTTSVRGILKLGQNTLHILKSECPEQQKDNLKNSKNLLLNSPVKFWADKLFKNVNNNWNNDWKQHILWLYLCKKPNKHLNGWFYHICVTGAQFNIWQREKSKPVFVWNRELFCADERWFYMCTWKASLVSMKIQQVIAIKEN